MSNGEECYLLDHTLYGVAEREDDERPEYDPMVEAESRWEVQDGR